MISRNYQYDNEIRKRQIDTLKIFNENVQEITRNEEYSVTFTTSGVSVTISVHLGQHFPNERPTVFVSPPVQHLWCNPGTGEIQGAPGLLNYSPHSDLGRIVQAIVREFERSPPIFVLSGHTSPIPAIQDVDGGSFSGTESLATSPLNYESASTIEISKMSLDELRRLDSDSQFLDDFVEELPAVQSLSEELDSMIDQVETLARESEAMKELIINMKSKNINDCETFTLLCEKYKVLDERYQKKFDEFAPQHIKELLQIAVSNADGDCEKCVEEFLSGKTDVQTFLNFYLKSKKLSAIRKAKEEQLARQIIELERAGH